MFACVCMRNFELQTTLSRFRLMLTPTTMWSNNKFLKSEYFHLFLSTRNVRFTLADKRKRIMLLFTCSVFACMRLCVWAVVFNRKLNWKRSESPPAHSCLTHTRAHRMHWVNIQATTRVKKDRLYTFEATEYSAIPQANFHIIFSFFLSFMSLLNAALFPRCNFGTYYRKHIRRE